MHYFHKYLLNIDINNLPNVSSDNLQNIIKLLIKDDIYHNLMYTIVNNNGITENSTGHNMQTLRYNFHNYIIMKTMMKSAPNDIVIKNAFSVFVDAQKSQQYQLSTLNNIVVLEDTKYIINNWVPIFNYRVTIDSTIQREWVPLSLLTRHFIEFWYKIIKHWLVLLKQNDEFVQNYQIKEDILNDILSEEYSDTIHVINNVFYDTIYMLLDRILHIIYPLKHAVIELQLPSYYTFIGIIVYLLIEQKDLILVLNNAVDSNIIDINDLVLI